jgi:hypothetical protein
MAFLQIPTNAAYVTGSAHSLSACLCLVLKADGMAPSWHQAVAIAPDQRRSLWDPVSAMIISSAMLGSFFVATARNAGSVRLRRKPPCSTLSASPPTGQAR